MHKKSVFKCYLKHYNDFINIFLLVLFQKNTKYIHFSCRAIQDKNVTFLRVCITSRVKKVPRSTTNPVVNEGENCWDNVLWFRGQSDHGDFITKSEVNWKVLSQYFYFIFHFKVGICSSDYWILKSKLHFTKIASCWVRNVQHNTCP